MSSCMCMPAVLGHYLPRSSVCAASWHCFFDMHTESAPHTWPPKPVLTFCTSSGVKPDLPSTMEVLPTACGRCIPAQQGQAALPSTTGTCMRCSRQTRRTCRARPTEMTAAGLKPDPDEALRTNNPLDRPPVAAHPAEPSPRLPGPATAFESEPACAV